MLNEEPMVSFTTFDRCDRCGVQAYAIAKKDGRADLLFCLHHIKEHQDALVDAYWTVTLDTEAVESLVKVTV